MTTLLQTHKPPQIHQHQHQPNHPEVYFRYGSVGRPSNEWKRKSAVELLQESKAHYVKSTEVLDTEQRLIKTSQNFQIRSPTSGQLHDLHLPIMSATMPHKFSLSQWVNQTTGLLQSQMAGHGLQNGQNGQNFKNGGGGQNVKNHHVQQNNIQSQSVHQPIAMNLNGLPTFPSVVCPPYPHKHYDYDYNPYSNLGGNGGKYSDYSDLDIYSMEMDAYLNSENNKRKALSLSTRGNKGHRHRSEYQNHDEIHQNHHQKSQNHNNHRRHRSSSSNPPGSLPLQLSSKHKENLRDLGITLPFEITSIHKRSSGSQEKQQQNQQNHHQQRQQQHHGNISAVISSSAGVVVAFPIHKGPTPPPPAAFKNGSESDGEDGSSPPPLPPKSPRSSTSTPSSQKSKRPQDFPQKFQTQNNLSNPPGENSEKSPPPPPRRHSSHNHNLNISLNVAQPQQAPPSSLNLNNSNLNTTAAAAVAGKSEAEKNVKNVAKLRRLFDAQKKGGIPPQVEASILAGTMTLPSPILAPTPPPTGCDTLQVESPLSDLIISPPPAFSTPVTPMNELEEDYCPNCSSRAEKCTTTNSNSKKCLKCQNQESELSDEELPSQKLPSPKVPKKPTASSSISPKIVEISRNPSSSPKIPQDAGHGHTGTGSSGKIPRNSVSPKISQDNSTTTGTTVKLTAKVTPISPKTVSSEGVKMISISPKNVLEGIRNSEKKSSVKSSVKPIIGRKPSLEKDTKFSPPGSRRLSLSPNNSGADSPISPGNSEPDPETYEEDDSSRADCGSVITGQKSRSQVKKHHHSSQSNLPGKDGKVGGTSSGGKKVDKSSSRGNSGQNKRDLDHQDQKQRSSNRTTNKEGVLLPPPRRPILRSKSDLSHRYLKSVSAGGLVLVHLPIDLGPAPPPHYHQIQRHLTTTQDFDTRRLSKSSSELEKFFDHLGGVIDQGATGEKQHHQNQNQNQQISTNISPPKGGKPQHQQHHDNSNNSSSPVFFSSVSSIDSDDPKGGGSVDSGDSLMAVNRMRLITGSRTVGGNYAQGHSAQVFNPQHSEPSIVERNARVIKWLFNCRKALEKSKR